MPLPLPSSSWKCGAATGRACPAGSMDFAAVEQKAEWRDERRKGGRAKNGSRSVEVDRARLAWLSLRTYSPFLPLFLSLTLPGHPWKITKIQAGPRKPIKPIIQFLSAWERSNSPLPTLPSLLERVCSGYTRQGVHTHILPPRCVIPAAATSLFEYGILFDTRKMLSILRQRWRENSSFDFYSFLFGRKFTRSLYFINERFGFIIDLFLSILRRNKVDRFDCVY